jgi:hypothetical protein
MLNEEEDVRFWWDSDWTDEDEKELEMMEGEDMNFAILKTAYWAVVGGAVIMVLASLA